MPIVLAILALFCVETFYLFQFNDLEAGFFPALIAALISYFFAQAAATTWAEKQNNPAVTVYQLPLPQVFSRVKKVLRTYHHRATTWRIDDDDPQAGTICASFRFTDTSWRDMRQFVPEGKLDRLILLTVVLTPNQNGSTNVELVWFVDSPVCAAECYAIVGDTSECIRLAMQHVEPQAVC